MMPASHPDIPVTRLGQTAILTLSRPAHRNAILLSMWRNLPEIIADLVADPQVRTIVLTGAGGTFSAGADIKEFATVRSTASLAEDYETAVDACCDAVMWAGKPTVAAVRGHCLGGACHLAMACDFRIAEENASFGIPAAKMSIVYGVKASQKLLALVGLTNAKKILYLGRPLRASQALSIGLVDEIAPDAIEAAQQMLSAINANAPLSVAGSKGILNGLALGLGSLDGSAAEASIRRAAASDDFVEGRRAFEEKRGPVFAGR